MLTVYKVIKRIQKDKNKSFFIGEHRSKEIIVKFFNEMKNEMVDPDKFIIKNNFWRRKMA